MLSLHLMVQLMVQPMDWVWVRAFAGDDDHTVYPFIFFQHLVRRHPLGVAAARASNTALRRQARSPGPVPPAIRALYIHDSH